MKHYELMSIYKLDVGDQKAKELSQKVQELISSNGGKVVKSDFWGKRKFAYEIKHATEGYYDITKFEMEPESLGKFKTKLNLVTDIVRYLVTAES